MIDSKPLRIFCTVPADGLFSLSSSSLIRCADTPQDDQLRFMTDEHSVELLIPHVNLYTYGCDVIKEDNAVLSPYGLLHRADYQPMLTPVQQIQEPEMTM